MRKKGLYLLSSRFYLIATLCFLFILDIFALWYASRLDYDRILDRARLLLQKTSISMEERVKRTIIATEAILHNRVQRIQETGIENTVSSVKEWERFKNTAKSLPDAGSLWLLDSKGRLLMDSTEYPSQKINFSEREYFVPQKNEGIEHYIGPVVRGRITGKYSFTISHRINGKNGQFLGIILAAIETDDFTNFLQNIDIGKGGTVSLFRTDGTLVLRQPMQDEYLGKTFTHLKLFSIPFTESPAGIYEASAIDGVRCLVAYRKIQNYPLLVATGIPVDSILEEWWTHVKTYSLAAILVFLALIALSLHVRKTTLREEEEKTQELSEINESLKREIIERKEAEEALRTSEEHYRSLFSNMLNGYAYCRMLFEEDEPKDFVYLSVNSTFETLTGLKNVTGKRVSEVIPGIQETDPELFRIYGRVALTGKPEQFEEYVNVLGMWFSISVYSPQKKHFVAIFDVITERKEAEEKLRKQHDRLDLAQRASGAGTWDWDIASGRLEWSSQLFELFGLNPQNTVESFDIWNSVLHPDDREMANMQINQALQKGTGLANEYRIVHPGGQVRWISALGHGTYDEAGHPVRMSGICIDITDRKEMEEEIRRSRDELESRVQERTFQLSEAYENLRKEIDDRRKLEDQLRQSQKLEAVGVLAGGIAHDFNNILAGIIGFAEMVLEDIDPHSPEHRRLELVLKGAHRGRDLVKQILTFSRRSEQDRQPVALTQIIAEGLTFLKPALPSTIQIIAQSLTEDDMILADSSQIQQVLMNLCTNAAHAMQENGGVLAVNITKTTLKKGESTPVAEMKLGEYVVLTVSDTGCGMTPETIERMFDPFFTTKKQGEGTGLGLSVVHGILKNHGGYIAVESEPGKGTLFHVYLPRIEEPAAAEAAEVYTTTGNNEHILVIDDEDILVELHQQRLSRLGYKVVATTSSLHALDLFRKEPDKFDLVLTDHTMPNLTGMDLAAELLKLKATIPIILCTGHNETVSPEQARAAGIKAFLTKPLAKEELTQTIRRLLDANTEK